MNSLLETEITEADIELFMQSFDCDRERAIELLIQEAQAKIQYEIYLNSPIDPRDQNKMTVILYTKNQRSSRLVKCNQYRNFWIR